jgi:hypothetical protein
MLYAARCLFQYCQTGQDPNTYSNLDLLSSSNIPPSGPNNHRFWAHLFSAYLVTIVALGVRESQQLTASEQLRNALVLM